MKPRPNIMIGNTYKLPKPVKYFSWSDNRTPEEIQSDIERRAKTKEQQKLDREIAKFLEPKPKGKPSRTLRKV